MLQAMRLGRLFQPLISSIQRCINLQAHYPAMLLARYSVLAPRWV
jgi:hypothetical protein